MSIITPSPWTQQPQVAVGIDWSNPITRGLVSVWVGNNYVDTKQIKRVPFGTPAFSRFGVGGKGNGSSISSVLPAGAIAAPANMYGTTFALIKVGAAAASNCIAGSGTGSYCWRVAAGGTLTLTVTGVGTAYISPACVSANEYCSVAITNGATTAITDAPKAYKNGLLVGTGTSVTAGYAWGPTSYLGQSGASTQYWDGEIFLHVHFARSLSAAEIKSLHDNYCQIFPPLTRRIYFDIAAGGGVQTLLPSLFTNAQTFYAPTVSGTGSTQTLLPSLVTNTQTFYAPTATPGAVALSPTLVTNSQTFYSPTITAANAPQTVLPSLVTNDQTFFGPTATTGAVSVTPSLFTNDQLFYGPAITTAITVAPTLATNTSTFYAPTVSPAYFENAQTFYAAELYRQGLAYVRDGYVVTGYVAEQGAVDLQPSLLTNAQTFYGPLVGRFSIADLEFLIAYMEAYMPYPTPTDIATAILAAAQITPIASNLEQVNAIPIQGAGTSGNPWGPAP